MIANWTPFGSSLAFPISPRRPMPRSSFGRSPPVLPRHPTCYVRCVPVRSKRRTARSLHLPLGPTSPSLTGFNEGDPNRPGHGPPNRVVKEEHGRPHLPWPVPHVFLHPHIQYNTQHLSIKCITHDSPPQLGRIPPSSTGGSCSIFNPFTSFYLYCMLLSEVVLGRPEPFSVRKQAIQGVPQSSTVHASTKAGDVQDDDPFQGRWDINLMADPSGVASNTHQAGFLQSTTFRKATVGASGSKRPHNPRAANTLPSTNLLVGC